MNRFVLWLVLLLPFFGFCQFSGFDFSITTSDETCSGSGSLSFTPSGVPAGATITYYVYLQPNLTVPVKTTTDPTAPDLQAGSYTVIASIELNGEETSVTHTAVIQDQRPQQPVFDFEIQAQNCNNLNQINVILLSGVATGYEIFNGPVTAPRQTSSLFTGLVDGEYIFLVYDGCGQAISRTFTAVFNPQPPVVSPPIIEEIANGNCTTFTLANTISYPAGTIITYPLTIQYTVHSPGVADIVVTNVINSGDLASVQVSNDFPYVTGATYTYDVSIVNGCGVSYTTNGNTVNPNPVVSISAVPVPCGKFYLTTNAGGYNNNYNITFVDHPADFNPRLFNTFYPGAYSSDGVAFGSDTMPVPEGLYKAFITDDCGRVSEVAEYNVEYVVPDPVWNDRNNGCFSLFGGLAISIPSRTIVSAIIEGAPPGYTGTLPKNVSSSINSNGNLSLTDLPIGQYYTIKLVDECGITYTVIAEIRSFTPRDLTAQSKADCTDGAGTVAVTSPNDALTSVSITAAPAGFTQALPFDVTNLIASNGRMYMDGLPAGTYTFTGTDACNITTSVSIPVSGKITPVGAFTFRPLCNSFNIELADPDPLSTNATYWLQIEDPNTPGVWLNPVDSTVYTEGEVPTAATGVQLTNNTNNINFTFSGKFRILKFFSTYGSGVSAKNCISQLGDTFEYYYNVVINNVFGIDCADHPDSVYIDAIGLAPLQYSIVDLVDENIVLLDNGTSPVFDNLVAGSYRFKVTNRCGESRLRQADITTLPDLVNAATPSDLRICVQPGESLNIPVDLTVQNQTILNGSIASQFSITYFRSSNDADNDINPIPNPEAYLLTSNPQTLYAKLNQIYVNLCPDIVSFSVSIGAIPALNVSERQYLCEDIGSLTIDADAGFDSYLWLPGGETTQSLTVTQPGNYSLTVISNGCSTTKNITVIPVLQPVIEGVETLDWTFDNNGFTVITAVPEMFLYSIDGINYQESNTFTGFPAGIYRVFVQDRQGCKATEREFALLYYPKFFTPNGDGYNETWRIQYSFMEPNLKVYIFDRYGKLITGFPSQSEGWDGTFNGHPLPSTDYWFVVERQDGRVHKGHFSLIR
jgi:gliding motility-associated-like protein